MRTHRSISFLFLKSIHWKKKNQSIEAFLVSTEGQVETVELELVEAHVLGDVLLRKITKESYDYHPQVK